MTSTTGAPQITTRSPTTRSPTTRSPTTRSPTTTYIPTQLPEMEDSETDISINIDEAELSETDIKINYIIDKIKSYSYNLKRVYSNNNDISDSFEMMKRFETDKKIDIIWDYLIKNYKNNYEYMLSNYDKIKKKNMKLLENKTKLLKIKKELKKLKENITTKDKLYKLNFNRYNEMIFETNLIKNFMIFLMVLLIIPILRLADVINKTLCVVSFCSLLAIGIIYTAYLFMSDRENRDNVFYNKLNFGKPGENIKVPETTRYATSTTGNSATTHGITKGKQNSYSTKPGTIIVEPES